MGNKNYLFTRTIDINTAIEELNEHLIEYQSSTRFTESENEKIRHVIREMLKEANEYSQKDGNHILNPALEDLFSRMSDQEKLSLFMRRSDSGIPTIFELFLDEWWANRY